MDDAVHIQVEVVKLWHLMCSRPPRSKQPPTSPQPRRLALRAPHARGQSGSGKGSALRSSGSTWESPWRCGARWAHPSFETIETRASGCCVKTQPFEEGKGNERRGQPKGAGDGPTRWEESGRVGARRRGGLCVNWCPALLLPAIVKRVGQRRDIGPFLVGDQAPVKGRLNLLLAGWLLVDENKLLTAVAVRVVKLFGHLLVVEVGEGFFVHLAEGVCWGRGVCRPLPPAFAGRRQLRGPCCGAASQF